MEGALAQWVRLHLPAPHAQNRGTAGIIIIVNKHYDSNDDDDPSASLAARLNVVILVKKVTDDDPNNAGKTRMATTTTNDNYERERTHEDECDIGNGGKVATYTVEVGHDPLHEFGR